MVKLKKPSVHKAICPTCRGNGFLKILDQEDPRESNVHQCWDCGSEGEFYVYDTETQEVTAYNPVFNPCVSIFGINVNGEFTIVE